MLFVQPDLPGSKRGLFVRAQGKSLVVWRAAAAGKYGHLQLHGVCQRKGRALRVIFQLCHLPSGTHRAFRTECTAAGLSPKKGDNVGPDPNHFFSFHIGGRGEEINHFMVGSFLGSGRNLAIHNLFVTYLQGAWPEVERNRDEMPGALSSCRTAEQLSLGVLYQRSRSEEAFVLAGVTLGRTAGNFTFKFPL